MEAPDWVIIVNLKYFFFFLATRKIIFLQIGIEFLPPDAHKLCFFLVQRVKTVILKMRSGGFFQKLTAILQHATAEKRAGDGMFFFFFIFKSSYLSFGLKFRYILMA